LKSISKNLKMKLIRNISCIGLFLSFLFLQSCVTDLTDDFDDLSNGDHTQSWAFPILHSKATLSDMGNVEDIETTDEGLIQFVMQKDSIFSVETTEVIELDQQVPFFHTIEFSDVVIPDFTTTGEVTFTEMFTNVNTAAANAILALDSTTTIVDPFDFEDGGVYLADSLTGYDWVEVQSGTIEIEISNTSNVPLTNVEVDIFGLNGSSLAIGTLTYASIPVGGSATEILDLANKTIDNHISFEITNFESPGSGGAIFVDWSQKLEFTFNSNEVKIVKGFADFDAPFYTGTFDYHLTDADSNELNSKFTKVRFKDGWLRYKMTPGLSHATLLEIRVPNSDDGTGNEVTFSLNLPSSSSSSIPSDSLELDNMEFVLDLNTLEPFNNLQFEFSNSFYENEDSTISRLRNFDLSENFNFEFHLDDIEFEYLEGFFEEKTITLEKSSFQWDSDLFNNMSGEINIFNPEISLITNSSIGVEFGLDVEGVARNIFEDSVVLEMDQTAILNGPSVSQAGQKIKDRFTYTKDNSNVEDIIPILPNRFDTYGNLLINPSGGNNLNFTFDTSSVEVSLRMAVPMEMIGGNIHVEDKQSFDQEGYERLLDYSKEETTKSIKLHFEMENAFPFAADISLVLIDSLDAIQGNVLDTINLPFLIAPAGVDADGIVNEPNFFNATVELDDAERTAMENATVSILVIDLIPNADDPDSEVIKVFEDDYLKTTIGVELNTIPLGFDDEEEE